MENLSPDTANSNTTSGNMQIHNLTAAYLDTIHHVNLNLCKTPTQTTPSESFAPAVFKPDPDGLQSSRGGTQAAGYEGHFGRDEGARAPPLYDTGVSFAVVWASSAGTKTRLAVAARLLGRGGGGVVGMLVTLGRSSRGHFPDARDVGMGSREERRGARFGVPVT